MMTTKHLNWKTILFLIYALILSQAFSAQSPFEIVLEPIENPDLAGVQSFCFAQHNGMWLIVGGRIDGLHRRQPWATFDVSGFNYSMFVFDPQTQNSWSEDVDNFPAELRDQLSSTNMQFYQNGDYLYLIGGYGYDSNIDDHRTFSTLLSINVPVVMEAIVNENDFPANSVRSVELDEFAVTGGQMEMIGNKYYLIGGQKFDGLYNPHDNPTFVQEYTNSVYEFEIVDDGSNLEVNMTNSWEDADEFHRRDYNVLPQIMPNGEEGFTMFSGVFQHDADIPWLNSVDFTSDGYVVNEDFSQYFNHYHCAHVPIYSEEANEMHNLFFGGIAQYYEEDDLLIVDDEVPFVKTIARVSRNENGELTEYKLPVEMPGYLGASAEFIPLEEIEKYSNGVLKLDAIEDGSTLIGYVFGGINSSEKNIFWSNDGTQSQASSTMYAVYLNTDPTNSTDELNHSSIGDLRMQLYPNPSDGEIHIKFNMSKKMETKLEIFDINGKLVFDDVFYNDYFELGENHIKVTLEEVEWGSTFVVVLSSGEVSLRQKLIINGL